MPATTYSRSAFGCGFLMAALFPFGGYGQDVPRMIDLLHCTPIWVFFDQGSATLSERWRQVIKDRMLADGACNTRPNPSNGMVIVVTGHTAGGADSVPRLGLRRANGVAAYLVDLGYAREDICTRSKESDAPFVLGDLADQQNRRVTLDFMGARFAPDECKRTAN